MLLRLLSVFGSIASLVGFIFIFHPQGERFTVVEGVFLGISFVVSVLAIGLEVKSYFTEGPIILKTKQAIRDYMFKWISHGGKVVIFSHNLSWVDDAEMISMLKGKARHGDLCICLPDTTPLTDELKAEGANICTYRHLKHVPQARFTIINAGRMDAQLAVGRSIKGKHCIEEFAAGQHPVFAVASDLVEIIMSYQATRRSS